MTDLGTTMWGDNEYHFDVFEHRQANNGGTEGGSWCERESREEAGEEPVKVGWTRGKMEGELLTKIADALRIYGSKRR